MEDFTIYPIGKAPYGTVFSDNETKDHLERIKTFPFRLNQVCSNLSEIDCRKTYREGGWMVAQIVHHISDSHINAYVRTKLALTEHIPTIKPYDENLWAATADALPTCDIAISLKLIESLHARWCVLLESIHGADYNKEYFHPEKETTITLRNLIGLYAWHGDHHLGQIKNALK